MHWTLLRGPEDKAGMGRLGYWLIWDLERIAVGLQ